MIAALITVLVALVILYCIKVILDYCEVVPPIRNVVLLIAALICILVLLNRLGLVGQPWW